jgi:hypothetical protein
MVAKNTKIIIAVVIVLILVGATVSVIELYHPAAKKQVFTDVSQTSSPCELDPATGFFTTDEPIYTALYQELVGFHGTAVSVEPVLAQKVTNVSEQNYTFTLRNYVTFSNGNKMTAQDVWFSLYRTLIMGQGVTTADYSDILYNGTNYNTAHIVLPWGFRNALKNDTSSHYTLTGNLTVQYKQAANDLDYILSNFNDNTSNQFLMSYAHQAVVVNSNYSVNVNGLRVYSFMLDDLAGWWGAVVDPSQIDANGGVVYNTQNTYVNENGAIGTRSLLCKQCL